MGIKGMIKMRKNRVAVALALLGATSLLYGCLPEASDGNGDDTGAAGQASGEIPGSAGGAVGDPGHASDAGDERPSARDGGPILGMDGAMAPGTGGMPAPGGDGGMTPAPRDFDPPEPAPEDMGVPAPEPEPEPEFNPCPYEAGEGEWFHLPQANRCLYYSGNQRLDYDDSVDACREMGASLPSAQTLNRYCDEIVLRPGHEIEGQQVSSKIRIADEYSDGHRLWHDRGYNSQAAECGVRRLGCGFMGHNGDCVEVNSWIPDDRRYKFACLRSARRPPAPPDPPEPEDMGVLEPDMAPQPAPLLNTRLSNLPQEYDSDNWHRFSFAAVGGEASGFECQLDDGPWFRCESPFRVDELAEGLHTFRVAAVNADGIPDRTPEEHTWTVDTIPPSCSFTRTEIFDPGMGQVGCRGNPGVRRWFEYEEGYTARCRQDIIPNSGRHAGAFQFEGDWRPCSSPHFYRFVCHGNLSTANETLVEITDRAGNTCRGERFGVRWECDRCN